MKLSVVTTLYRSEAYVSEFLERISSSAGRFFKDIEFIFVNDGSTDRAVDILLKKQKSEPRITVIDLSRNFGHHRALMTGLRHSDGDFVFMIDSDLEERPELIETYWSEHQKKPLADVIYGVQARRKGAWFERISGRIWYRLFSLISSIDYPADTLTARLMTRRYVDAVLLHSERELELRGVLALAGFEQQPVVVDKGSKGQSSYTLGLKLRIVADSITSFSSAPLVGLFLLGLLMTGVSMAVVIYLIAIRLIYNHILEGWVSTVVSIWFVGGLIIFSLGVIGIYLAKMFLEIKGRPLTIIRKIHKVGPLIRTFEQADRRVPAFNDSAGDNEDAAAETGDGRIDHEGVADVKYTRHPDK